MRSAKTSLRLRLLSLYRATGTAMAKVLYHLFKYRRKVVMKNLEIAFPEFTGSTRQKIAYSFYHRFCVNWMEAVWILFSRQSDIKSICIGNYSMLEHYNSKGINCMIWLGHQFNWEIANAHLSLSSQFKSVVVYRRISNNYVNSIFKKLRSKYGSIVVEDRQIGRFLSANKDAKFNLIFVGDQNPPFPNNALWVDFFGKKTPFPKGMALLAAKLNYPLFTARISSNIMGRYKVAVQFVIEKPASVDPVFLLQNYAYQLEEYISLQPSNYMWTHRRWKHSIKED